MFSSSNNRFFCDRILCQGITEGLGKRVRAGLSESIILFSLERMSLRLDLAFKVCVSKATGFGVVHVHFVSG